MMDLLAFVFPEKGWAIHIAYGLWITITLALWSLPFGVLLGLASALCIKSSSKILSVPASSIALVFRSLPELLTLFLIYYGVGALMTYVNQAWIGRELLYFDAFVAGVVALSLVYGSFSSDAFVAALNAVPRGQFEAARSLGLNAFATYVIVIIPQIIRYALPSLGNLWFIILKDTSIVSVIALPELMRQSQLAAANTKQPLTYFGIALMLYLLMSAFSYMAIVAIRRRLRVE